MEFHIKILPCATVRSDASRPTNERRVQAIGRAVKAVVVELIRPDPA
jgi:hypothetical protein